MSLKCIPKHEISKMHLSDIVTKMIKFSTPAKDYFQIVKSLVNCNVPNPHFN